MKLIDLLKVTDYEARIIVKESYGKEGDYNEEELFKGYSMDAPWTLMHYDIDADTEAGGIFVIMDDEENIPYIEIWVKERNTAAPAF